MDFSQHTSHTQHTHTKLATFVEEDKNALSIIEAEVSSAFDSIKSKIGSGSSADRQMAVRLDELWEEWNRR